MPPGRNRAQAIKAAKGRDKKRKTAKGLERRDLGPIPKIKRPRSENQIKGQFVQEKKPIPANPEKAHKRQERHGLSADVKKDPKSHKLGK